ncbi:MAG: Fe-S cluster assembly protein SufB, partial [Coriobacteriales bacterium]|nr:Fe-S cluster assembly protein SufB [Coriobacteriales bacterium]
MESQNTSPAPARKRTQVADVDRSMYDFRYDDSDAQKLEAGLTPDIVREISQRKNEPQWMLEHRLRALEIYNAMPMSDWGPSIAGLDMDHIVTYVKPN